MTLGVAVVTGAARGIGRAIALRLAKDGYNIALNDIGQQGKFAELQNEIKSLGRESIECMADVTKEAEVKEMVSQAVKKLGGLDVVRGFVGGSNLMMHKAWPRWSQMRECPLPNHFCIVSVIISSGGLVHVLSSHLYAATIEDWDRVFNLNGKGVFLCYKHAAQVMIDQGRGGRIIGACSVAGKQGDANDSTHSRTDMLRTLGFDMLSLYSASKFTVRSLTQTAGFSDAFFFE